MGTEPFLDLRLQARLNDAILRQSASPALQVMLKLPEAGKLEPSFTSIRQQVSEPYTQFIDIDNCEAKEALMAAENANADRKIVQALPINTTLPQTTEACDRVGSIEHHAIIALAVAFAVALQMGGRRCFRGQATGHFAAECPQRGAGKGDMQ